MPRGSLGVLLVLAGLACSEESRTPEREQATPDPPSKGTDPTLCNGRRRPIYVDQDGDGFSVGKEVGGRCEEDGAGEGYSFNPPSDGGTDCDDADPDRSRGQNFYTDADGDGFGVPLIEHRYGCEGIEIEGFAPNANDCDDTDPRRQVERALDEDGDGFGVSDARSCVALDEPGYSNLEGDCDDEDARISPDDEEIALDGVDSDCDGHDFPLQIDAGSSCAPPVAVAGEVTPTPDCSGPDVFIAAFAGCTDCSGGHAWLQIANAGSEAGEVELVFSALPNQPPFDPVIESLGELAPGALSEFFEPSISPPGVSLRVRVSGADEDCSPLNESLDAQLGFVDCVFK